MTLLSAAYGRAVLLRRSWYERHPQARRHLDRPVVSVGNLSVGGSGKTPVVAALARLLLALGERPAILSRGYARREPVDGVVVVSDGARVLAPVARSGDEPSMLARDLPGVRVLVCPDRYLAGRLAERRLDATVHLLDDGFQHLTLGRATDIVVLPAADLEGRPLPSGRLREPIEAGCAASCLLVPGAEEDAARVSAAFEGMPVFRIADEYGTLRALDSGDDVASGPLRVVAVAGIARPRRFFEALRASGHDVVREIAFADHHWFSRRDLDRVQAAARAAGADLVVTTAKDAARLAPLAGWAVLPQRVSIEPADRFVAWLRERL